MSMHIESELATPDEVAQDLRVDRRTVLAAVRRGEIPAVKVGKQVRIAWTDVARLRTYSVHGHNRRSDMRGTP